MHGFIVYVLPWWALTLLLLSLATYLSNRIKGRAVKIVTRSLFNWRKDKPLMFQAYLPSLRWVGNDFCVQADFKFRLALKPLTFGFQIFGFGVGFTTAP